MPDFKNKIRARLAELGLAPTREAEIVEEISHHLEDGFEEAVSHGASEEEATRSALSELDNVLTRELQRVERRAPQNPVLVGTTRKSSLVADARQDIRYALRMFIKNPA